MFHADFESYSETDIRACGAFRYAACSSTEITLMAIAEDDAPPLLWDAFASAADNAPALALIRKMVSSDGLIYAQNVKFEMAIMHYIWERTFNLPVPERSRFRCTQVMANMAGIPSSLDGASTFLKLQDGKDPRGKKLIQVFAIPDKKKGRNLPTDEGFITVAGEKMTYPQAWALFRNYCLQDVVVERGIHKALAVMELKGATLDAFLFDLDICFRGVPVNLKAVDAALKIEAECTEKAGREFENLTGVKFTQRGKVLEWLKARGYPEDDMKATTVAKVLTGVVLNDDGEETGEVDKPKIDQMAPEAVDALRLRGGLTFAAVKKIQKMKTVACPDGRIRGMINFYGAARTGRSSSQLVQIQNLRKSSFSDSGMMYRMIEAGTVDADDLDLMWGPPVECLASCIRHFIDLGPERQLNSSDLSQVESRMLAWLCDDKLKLRAFKDGLDIYNVVATQMFNVEYSEVSKEQRTRSKVAELSLGFQGGHNALLRMAEMYKMELSEEKARELVKAWRAGNQAIVKMWKTTQEAALEAINRPGNWVRVNDKLRLAVTRKMGFPSLIMELPSGRWLSHPLPQVHWTYKIKDHQKDKWVDISEARALGGDGEPREGVWATQQITFYGKLEGKSVWGRVNTHGGSLLQSATQAASGDLMWHGSVTAQKAGLKCLFPCHDELVTEYWPEHGDTVEKLEKCMESLPDWASTFPTKAVGGLSPFYTK